MKRVRTVIEKQSFATSDLVQWKWHVILSGQNQVLDKASNVKGVGELVQRHTINVDAGSPVLPA